MTRLATALCTSVFAKLADLRLDASGAVNPGFRYEWAHNLGESGPPEDYVAMCHRCHNRFDAAIRMMQQDPADDYRHGWRPWVSCEEARRREAALE